jgi:hypothetical protein
MSGSMKALKFIVIQPKFTIYRLETDTHIPKSVFDSSFYFISKTDEELSIVVPDTVKIEQGRSDPDWRALKVAGPLDFSLTGILSEISTILAEEKISIFAISTFDTDYILVKSGSLKQAKTALAAAGHSIGRVRKQSKKLEQGIVQNGAKTLLEKQIPLLRKLFIENINSPILTSLRNDAALAVMVGGVYDFLPTPVRLGANRDFFVQFCISNLDKILPDAIEPATINRRNK